MAYYDTEFDEFMDRFGGSNDSFNANKLAANSFADNGATSLTAFDKKNNSGFANSLVGNDQKSNASGMQNSLINSGANSKVTAKGGKGGKGMMGKMGKGQMGAMFTSIGSGLVKEDEQVGDATDNAMVDQTKDSVAGAIGPIGQLFRGIQKMGQGIGTQIGGEQGAAVSGAFSPEEATMANMKDKDLSVGEKLLGTVPGLGGVIATRSKNEKIAKERTKQNEKMQKAVSAKLLQEFDQEEGRSANRELSKLRKMQLGLLRG